MEYNTIIDYNILITSLVTLAVGLIGTFFGYLGVMHSARIQVKNSQSAQLFDARLKAYTALYENYAAYIENPNNQNLSALIGSLISARLVASDESIELLYNFQSVLNIVKTGKATDEFKEAYQAMIDSLRADLIGKNKKLFNRRRKYRE